MANRVRYVWNAQDAMIAQGDATGSAQGPYVTPFGIPPNQVPGCKDFTAGSEVEVDLDKAMAGEVWRSRRFHVHLPFAYHWDDFQVPDSVTTLGGLCKHLVEADPIQFPKSIYGEEKVKLPGPDNPAQMLFDYWGNSKYRYAVVKSGFDWTTYTRTPGDLPVVKDGVKLAQVLFKAVVVKLAAVAPGPAKKGIDEPALDVEEYATRISALAANVRTLLETSARVMKERFQIIYRLQALRAIASATTTSPTDGGTSQGVELVGTVDRILPKCHKLLVAQPIRTGSSEQKLLEVFSEKKEFTNDAVADLAAARHQLRNLLLDSVTQKAALQAWAKSVQPGFVEARPDVTALVDKLTAAMAEGHLALGECGPQGSEDDALLAVLDAMPEKHALSPDDVKGDSPTAVVLSLVGKGVSIATTTVGNLAGPPSLSIAMTQVYATWKFTKLAKDSLAELNAIPSGVATIAIKTEAWMKLANRMTDHLPNGQVKDDVKAALLMQDRKALMAMQDKFGAEMAGSKQQTVPWKGAMVILGLITSILAINDAAASSNKSFAMFAVDFTGMTAGGVQVALGSYEAYMTAMGRLTDVAEALGKAGSAVGAVSSVIGLVQGIAGYAEAYQKANGYGLIINSLGIAGSLGMSVVAGVAAFSGPALPVVATVSLACLLLSGAVSLAQVVDSLDNTALKTNLLCYGLVRAIRGDTLGQFLETSDADIQFGMEDLEKVAKSGRLPYANNSIFTVLDLARAGLAESMIKDVVNSAALANTYFGPGLAPGVPTQS